MKLEKLYKLSGNSEMTFILSAEKCEFDKEEIQSFLADKYDNMNTLDVRRMRRQRLKDIATQLENGHTLQWIADTLYITRQRAHQLFKQAVKKQLIEENFRDKYKF